jgi:hypothetical protein
MKTVLMYTVDPPADMMAIICSKRPKAESLTSAKGSRKKKDEIVEGTDRQVLRWKW